MDLMAGALGLEIHRVDLPDLGLSPNLPEQESDRVCGQMRRQYPPILREAAGESGVLMTEGGWQLNGPHGFVPWCVWGIITEFPDGGPMAGATFNGHLDNPLDYLEDVWVVRSGIEPMPAADAARAMLQRAVARVRGDIVPAEAGADHPARVSFGRLRFGLSGVDRWIEQMQQVPGFCPECQQRQQRGWRCAVATAQTAYEGAKVAAAELRKQAAAAVQQAPAHLQEAALCYDRIAESLGPAITQDSGMYYEQFVGDLDKQKSHADSTLRPMRAQLAAAADEMEAAVSTMTVPTGRTRQ